MSVVGHVVVHRRDGEVGTPHGAPGEAEAVERLRRRDLVHEVEVDVEEVGLALGAADDVALPHLLAQGLRPCLAQVCAMPRFCQPGREVAPMVRWRRRYGAPVAAPDGRHG